GGGGGVVTGGRGGGQFRGGTVPALAGPRGVLPVHEAKRLAVPPRLGQLGPEIAHNRGIGRELWGRQGGRWRGPDGGAIQVMLQPGLRRIFITVRHKVPLLAPHERGKEPTGILTPDDL